MLTGWHHAELPLDVNASGLVTALDALLVINELNAGGSRVLPAEQPVGQKPRYIDTNNNGRLSAMDALLVINALNLPRQPIGLVLSIDPAHDANSNGVVLRDQIRLVGQTIPGARVSLEIARLDATLSEVESQTQSLQLTAGEDGRFTVEPILFVGLNSLTASSRDLLGRSTTLHREILRADIVADWNAAILNVVRDWTGLSNDPYPGRIVPSKPPVVARNLALIHTAMFEAMNAVAAEFTSYLDEPILVSASVSAEAAGIVAAYQVARSLYPGSRELAVWEATRFETLATVAEGTAKQAGMELGQMVAARILATRVNDGSDAAEVHIGSEIPGGWARTAPDFLPPLLPHWGRVRPLAVQDVLEFRPGPPPDLSTSDYAAAVDEVMRLGRFDSSERTAEQTEIALFWADGGGTATPPGHWNRIATRISVVEQESTLQRARTLALLNLAMADAGIASWDAKYLYDFWRPIDAIRRADQDGNADTTLDTSWLPLVRTPPFPAYTSGHSTFSGAAAAVLTALYGEDIAFASQSDAHSGLTQRPLTQIVERQFSSFAEAAEEAGQSRIYGGIHFQFDNSAGLAAGQSIGGFVVENLLRIHNTFPN